MKQLWVYNSWELLAKAQQLIAGQEDWQLTLIVDSNGAEAARYADRVYQLEGLPANDHLAWASALTPLLKEEQPEILLFPVSNFCGSLAATLGARLGTGVIAHGVDARLEDQALVCVIPAFGGQYLGDILCPVRRPQIAGLRASGQQPQPRRQAGQVIVLRPPVTPGPYRHLGRQPLPQAGQRIEEAEFILCGGLGVGSAGNWALLEQVAARLGATVACTRPPIDEGWAAGEQMMIGTSGKYVSPRVYLGFGVSGTAHHICGMQDSGLIINVNTDPQAPALALSDYALVADAAALLQELDRALEADS